MDLSRSYNAKILLFGEYTILHGAQALAKPLELYSAKFHVGERDPGLDGFFNHLMKLGFIDQARLKGFIEKGASFQSDIPQGYGLGSSAALSAASYTLFAERHSEELSILREELARIEDHFHGKSSGLDALCVYLNKAIHIKGEEDIDIAEDCPSPEDCFIIDSGLRRNTKALVNTYVLKLESEEFKKNVEELKEMNARAISSLLEEDQAACRIEFQKISKLQYDYFTEMIPDTIRLIWQKGLDSGDYFLKLCGAGGGGMFLGQGKIQDREDLKYIT